MISLGQKIGAFCFSISRLAVVERPKLIADIEASLEEIRNA